MTTPKSDEIIERLKVMVDANKKRARLPAVIRSELLLEDESGLDDSRVGEP